MQLSVSEHSSGMNVSKEKDIAFMRELEKCDPQRFARLQKNIFREHRKGKS